MRTLAWVTGGILGACVLCAYVLGSFPLGAAAMGLLLPGLFLMARKQKSCRIAALLTLGAFLGFSWYAMYTGIFLNPLKAYEHKVFAGEVLMLDVLEPEGGNRWGNGIVHLENRPYGVQVYLREGSSCAPGDVLRGSFQVSLPEEKDSRPGEGIFLLFHPEGEITAETPEKTSFLAWPGMVKDWAEGVISWCFGPKTGPFARALLLGDTEGLPFSVKWDLRISGISHLVAVSGLHVSVLCMLLGFLTLQNKWLTAILGLPLLVFFGAVTGFSPSVFRACIMMLLLLGARLLNRRYDPLTELSCAVSLMLLLNPLTVRSVSFQLSVSSVLGIFLFYKWCKYQVLLRIRPQTGRRETLRLWFSGSVAISCASLAFVTPLAALYFGSVSLIAPLTNLLVVFLVPVIFWGILGTLALSLLSMGAASALAALISLGISWILGVSHVLGKLPLAAVFTESPWILLWLLMVYLLGAFFLRKNHQEVSYFLRFSAAGLLLAAGLSMVLPLTHSVSMKVYDVGQGQAILLQSGGKNFLVDCGGNREDSVAIQVLTTLRSQGIRRLDGMILTHSDRDHICAADEILSVIQADAVYVPQREGFPPYPAMEIVKGEREISTSQGKLKIFGSESGETSNEMSLCVLLDSSEYDILITGDRSREGEAQLLSHHQIPRVDCLIAGHHGAADSTGEALLKAAEPETVIISAGRKNRYGHPAGETLRRLQSFGCRILRTDTDGTITIRR